MKTHLIIVTLAAIIPPMGIHATTVWCSATTCGDWDEANSSDFCGSSHKWCKESFAAELGYGNYKYCIPFGGHYLLESADTYSASLKIICFSDMETCNAIASQTVPWDIDSDYMHPKSGYFIACDSTGTTSSNDVADDIYACLPGTYSRKGVKARYSDGGASLDCFRCSKGYYSEGVASACTQCPSSGGITGTTATTNSTSITECYIPAGELTWTDETGTYMCGENSYYNN